MSAHSIYGSRVKKSCSPPAPPPPVFAGGGFFMPPDRWLWFGYGFCAGDFGTERKGTEAASQAIKKKSPPNGLLVDSPIICNGCLAGTRTPTSRIRICGATITPRGNCSCFPYWRGRRGSNPQPPDRQSSALTNCATTPCSVKRGILYHNSPSVRKGVF